MNWKIVPLSNWSDIPKLKSIHQVIEINEKGEFRKLNKRLIKYHPIKPVGKYLHVNIGTLSGVPVRRRILISNIYWHVFQKSLPSP